MVPKKAPEKIRYQPRVTSRVSQLTIYTLKTTARWRVDIVAIGTVQLHGVKTRQIGTSTRRDVGRMTVYPGARPKMPRFVLLHL